MGRWAYVCEGLRGEGVGNEYDPNMLHEILQDNKNIKSWKKKLAFEIWGKSNYLPKCVCQGFLGCQTY